MGKHAKITLELQPAEMVELRKMLRGGVQPVRVVQRARCLLLLSEGKSAIQVGKSTGVSAQAVRDISRRYKTGGLSGALHDRPRPGAEPRLNDSEEQRIIAMICADPPEGRARWTVRLITAEAVKRKLVPGVGRETIRLLLERRGLKPWREKNVVCSGVE
jgi:transposase